GGQRRRLAIALELLARPGLLLLDEPATGLDPARSKRLLALLRTLADKGCTVVLVTHATADIALCDRVAVLGQDGRLCFYGPAVEAPGFFDTADFAGIYTCLTEDATSAAMWEVRFQQSPYYEQYIGNQPVPPAPTVRPSLPRRALCGSDGKGCGNAGGWPAAPPLYCAATG
ncbi:MAG: AAA family ATPase, partial [Chloroflexaceae bacterium]|nr:AAA family ATPase [Chloroflexaceae bacterium]